MSFLKRMVASVLRAMQQHLMGWLIAVLLLTGGLIILWSRIILIVHGGELATLYRPLAGGIDLQRVYGEGVHVIYPWNSATKYDARIQIHKVDLQLLTADQLEAQVSVTFQYEISPNSVPLLHKYAGPDYLQKMIVPQVVSIVREMVAKHGSKSAYTNEIQQVIKDIAITADSVIIDELSPPGLSNVRLVHINAVQLAAITYPEAVKTAIQNKMIEAQNADAYQYKIESSTKEAERKIIEAQGIKQFQDIAFRGDLESYLRYRGIEATESLGKSENSKVLLFGSGSSGLPLVLGDIPAKHSTILK